MQPDFLVWQRDSILDIELNKTLHVNFNNQEGRSRFFRVSWQFELILLTSIMFVESGKRRMLGSAQSCIEDRDHLIPLRA
mmetsp:Transcript_97540/g.168983  ORF Transcript_97540/g.168983 Transcript_97540/m.168983 type:complete len:80 (+) Transcript_97540:194-433(+)